MQELTIGDRRIDKTHGVVIIHDVLTCRVIFKVEETGEEIHRSILQVQSMPVAPRKDIILNIAQAVVIGAFVIGFVTLIVIVASKVVIVQMGQ